jgi:hypothetical protein
LGQRLPRSDRILLGLGRERLDQGGERILRGLSLGVARELAGVGGRSRPPRPGGNRRAR